MDEAHTSHFRRQLIDLVERAPIQRQRLAAIRFLPEIELLEFVRRIGRPFMRLDIDTAYPVALSLEFLDQMAGNETTRTAYKCFFHRENPSIGHLLSV